MKQSLTIITLLFILGSCGPAAKLRRAQRLIDKAEEQGAVWSVDTVYKETPVILTETRVDSVFTSEPGDTVVIFKDRLKLKYVRIPGDSVFIEGKCEADTVVIRTPVTVTKVIKAPKSRVTTWDWIILCVVLFLMGHLRPLRLLLKLRP